MKIKFLQLVILFSSIATSFSQSPGNVSTNLRLWIKANSGTSCTTGGCVMTSWANQVSITDVPTSFTAAGTARPAYLTASLNYNPAVEFNALNNMAGPINNGIIPYATDVTNFTFIAVASSSSNEGTLLSDNLIYSTGGTSDQGWQVGMGNDYSSSYPTAINSIDYRSEAANVGNVNFRQNTGANTLLNNRPYIIGMTMDYTTPGNSVFSTNLAGLTTSNGYLGSTAPTKTRIEKRGIQSVIGTSFDAQASNWSPNFQGTISEMIVYNRTLTTTEKQKVHSYLGLKYSLTQDRIGIGNAYLNSGGASIYPSGGIATYWNDIIGIAQDNQSGLLQKQSRQQDDVTRVYISSLSSTNAINSGAFTSDNQFVVMGHDNTPIANNGSAEFPSGLGIYGRIDREWKIVNTAFNSTFSIDIRMNSTPINPADLRVLIDTDGDFTNATMYSPTISYTGGYITVSGITTAMIPTNTIRYLTIVTLSSATPLPIELVTFDATLVNPNLVQLNWTTNSELNSDYFVVESSSNGIDWSFVAQQKAANHSTSKIDYVDYDYRPQLGTNYYRLKQVDTDGVFKYSPIRLIDISRCNQLYPNVVIDRFTYVSDQKVEVYAVYNQLGQVVTSEVDILVLESRSLLVNCSHLTSGVYYLIVNGEAIKFVKN